MPLSRIFSPLEYPKPFFKKKSFKRPINYIFYQRAFHASVYLKQPEKLNF